MDTQIISMIEPDLYKELLTSAQNDPIIAATINKMESIELSLNALIACIICISDRELQNMIKVDKMLKSNPTIQEILNAKNDQITSHKQENPPE